MAVSSILLLTLSLIGGVYSHQCSMDTSCRGEVVFALDESGSIGQSNWDNQVVPFTNGIIDALGGHVHYGVVTFNSAAFEVYSLCDAQDDCDTIKNSYTNAYNGGGTSIANGAIQAASQFDSCDDPDLPNIIVLLTDGQSSGSCSNTVLDALADKTVFLIKIGSASSTSDCIATDPDEDHIFSVPNINELVDFIEAISTAICSVSCPCEAGVDNCLSCNDDLGSGCTACDYEYELVWDEDCGTYKCEEESCGPEPVDCDTITNLDSNGCPIPCDTDPCDCTTDCLHCEFGLCHPNGCDQCESGYFKKHYNYPCVSCQDAYGDKCLFCQDFNGCGQCAQGYNRVWDATCGLHKCI